MTSLSTATALLLWLSTQAPATPAAPASADKSAPAAPGKAAPAAPGKAAPPFTDSLEIRHVPLAQGFGGKPLVLEAEVTPAIRLAALIAHHRFAGETDFRETAFARTETGRYAAILPLAPGPHTPVEYYLTARDTDGKESVRFASAELPHTVLIEVPERLLEREALLEAYGRRTSRVALAAEYVDYGTRRLGNARYVDRYYRIESDYLYRMLSNVGGLRVDSIRIGVGHLRARVPPEQPGFPPLEGPSPQLRTGLDYGFSELDLGLSSAFGVTGRLVLGGNAEGFAAGVGGRLRIGRPHGSRLELEAETTSGLGSTATLRLGWDTVPRIPMSAAVQVTSFPVGPTGVRLLYRADFEVSDSFTLGALVGYQGRVSIYGGPTVGLSSSYSW
jgi:hypothetical protein